jgi:amidase
MSGFSEYDDYDGVGLAELVQRKEVSAEEVVEAAIARIEARNPRLNAVIHTMYDEGRAAVKSGLPSGPFTGVPLLLKDLLSTYAGVPLRNGSRYFKDYIPHEDSELVRRYKAAGLVILGKTNTPEFGITGVTEPELFGPTNNPWKLTHTAGGSSGGSAAAVAARMVPLAHGGDGLGSIRIPASCCGIFGLKPTRGRTPTSLDYEPWQGLVCEHVLTRSVRDSAAILDATNGTIAGAFYHPSPPRRPFLEEVGADPGHLRIAFSATSLLGDTVDDACRQALEGAARLCRELGHQVIEDVPAIDGPANAEAILMMLAGEIRADIEEGKQKLGRRPTPDQFELATWALSMLGGHFSAADFVAAMRLLQRTSHEIGRFMAEYDLFLTPTTAQPPVETGSILPQGAEAIALKVMNRLGSGRLLDAVGMLQTAAADSFRFTPYTPLINVTGRPAMSVPLYWTDDGLPIGMHFVGHHAEEATLFRLAAQLEQACPWKDRRPPLA